MIRIDYEKVDRIIQREENETGERAVKVDVEPPRIVVLFIAPGISPDRYSRRFSHNFQTDQATETPIVMGKKMPRRWVNRGK